MCVQINPDNLFTMWEYTLKKNPKLHRQKKWKEEEEDDEDGNSDKENAKQETTNVVTGYERDPKVPVE